MCIVCHAMNPKKDLVRVVKKPDGTFELDLTSKANGRGAYLCNNPECITKCLTKKMLNRAFKEAISDDVYKKLSEEYAKKQSI